MKRLLEVFYAMDGLVIRKSADWIGQEFWGKGITTRALSIFLKNIDIRPLYARVVKDNIGSIKVLEKCGFVPFGEDRGFANARGEEVDELIFVLR